MHNWADPNGGSVLVDNVGGLGKEFCMWVWFDNLSGSLRSCMKTSASCSNRYSRHKCCIWLFRKALFGSHGFADCSVSMMGIRSRSEWKIGSMKDWSHVSLRPPGLGEQARQCGRFLTRVVGIGIDIARAKVINILIAQQHSQSEMERSERRNPQV